MSLGPVLHPDDAVANKMCALSGRAEARDFLDVDAVLQSGRYTICGDCAVAARPATCTLAGEKDRQGPT
jgi:hypothetical protein